MTRNLRRSAILPHYAQACALAKDAAAKLAGGNTDDAANLLRLAISHLREDFGQRAREKQRKLEAELAAITGETKSETAPLAKTTPTDDVALLRDMVAARMPIREELEKMEAKKVGGGR
jgi:hypothetical protein